MPQGPEKLVCFELAGQAFGLPIRSVKETLPMRPLTRVLLVSPIVAGLMNLRGEVVAVLDLAQMIGLHHQPPRGGQADAAVLLLRVPDSWGGRTRRWARGVRPAWSIASSACAIFRRTRASRRRPASTRTRRRI